MKYPVQLLLGWVLVETSAVYSDENLVMPFFAAGLDLEFTCIHKYVFITSSDLGLVPNDRSDNFTFYKDFQEFSNSTIFEKK